MSDQQSSSSSGGNNDVNSNATRDKQARNEYETEGSLKSMRWELVSQVRRNPRQYRILHALAGGVLDPQAIARLTRIARNNLYSILTVMQQVGLVECLTPQERYSKIYTITKTGELVRQKAQTMHSIKRE